MSGPPPKDPKLRQRRNRTSTAARLVMSSPVRDEAAILRQPDLPIRRGDDRPWHRETVDFWTEVWASPMAAEFIAADIPGLILLARLVDQFNYGETGLAAEIRLQRQCFGLTPLDRRRLQWEIERVEAAGRRRPTNPARPETGIRDPRRALRAVK
jgi:hypothetical protein